MKVLDEASGGTGGVTAGEELVFRFDALLADMARIGDRVFVTLAARFEQRLETERLVAVARLAGADGDTRSQRRRARAHLSGGPSGRSQRSLNRDARRAAALAANPRLGAQALQGALTGDGIDALSRAADETTGEIPADLLDRTGGLEPDQSARLVEQYLNERAPAADANARYEAQMAARRVRRYTVPACGSDPGLAGLGVEGPDAIIDQLWALLNSDADAAYQTAGGRDRAADQHVPLDHRRFDAALGRLRGTRGTGGGSRPCVVITIGVGDLTGDAANRRAATQIGCGPISDQLVAELAASGDLAAMVVGLDGRPLWLGRADRHATAAQYLALAVRDRGCVLCGAAFQRCHAHHVIPWHAPAKGRTDLDNLALLCGGCHRRIHDGRETLVRRPSPGGGMVWSTRPATEAELPSPRPIQRE
ncbi:MAG: HNH endonuclease [Acidimicrobiia bacterium]|nr:HNH endonuclease [Acidimicrobiia bacterium]